MYTQQYRTNLNYFFADATQYAHYVFNTLKQNSSGQISFEVSRLH